MLDFLRRYVVLIFGTCCIAALGALGVWLEGKRADADLRSEIAYTVDLALAATDPDQIDALPVTPEDISNPIYRRLRERYLKLQNPLNQKKIRWIYAMKAVGNEIRFIVDSAAPDDPGHSEPGLVYEQPPVAVFDVMKANAPKFTGPYTDEYGTYYSVFAPINRAGDGKVVGVLGADIEAHRYSALIRARQRVPVLITLLVEILFVMLFLYVHRHKQIERLKSEFISIASHQLKSPITALRWTVESLVKDKAVRKCEGVREQVLQSQEIVKHMNDLVNALLNVSRVETGRIAVHTEMTNIVDLAEDMVKETAHMYKAKKQLVSVDAQERLPKISVDPLLISEVLKNLFTNAIKYTPKSGEIAIRLSKSGSDILIRMADNGYGIPKDEHKRVFKKFYRGTNIVSLEPDGNGLGLYLVKKIIDLSGGKIWFDSVEGQGTTFSFTLPISGSQPRRGEKSLA